MNLAAILSGVGTLEKIVPVIESIGAHIGPLVETEVDDGKAIWADVVKAYKDLQLAVDAVKSAAGASSK